jgi:hypothetical protein
MEIKSMYMRLVGHVVHIQILNASQKTMKKRDQLAVLGIDEKMMIMKQIIRIQGVRM